MNIVYDKKNKDGTPKAGLKKKKQHCHALRTNDSYYYSYRKGFKKVSFYRDLGTDFLAHWVNGVDTSKYDYEVKQDAVQDHGDKIHYDKRTEGKSTFYDWMDY